MFLFSRVDFFPIVGSFDNAVYFADHEKYILLFLNFENILIFHKGLYYESYQMSKENGIMDIEKRIRYVRILNKIKDRPEYSRRLGITDRSVFSPVLKEAEKEYRK